MKPKNLFAALLMLGLSGGMCDAMAADQCTQFYPSDMEAMACQDVNMEFDESEVSYGSSRYYRIGSGSQCVRVRDALSCPAGYVRTRVSLEDCTNSIQYWNCVCTCNNCDSDTDWSAVGAGYEKRTSRYCYCSTGSPICEAYSSYRCAIGYYGSSSNGTSGCTRCSASDGVYGTTRSAGSSSSTACYIPSGALFSDAIGSGNYTGDCFYTN